MTYVDHPDAKPGCTSQGFNSMVVLSPHTGEFVTDETALDAPLQSKPSITILNIRVRKEGLVERCAFVGLIAVAWLNAIFAWLHG